jgi:hypothetical protein
VGAAIRGAAPIVDDAGDRGPQDLELILGQGQLIQDNGGVVRPAEPRLIDLPTVHDRGHDLRLLEGSERDLPLSDRQVQDDARAPAAFAVAFVVPV